MKVKQERTEVNAKLVSRLGFYLDIMNYQEMRPLALEKAQAEKFIQAYEKMKSGLGHVSYTEIARALQISPQEVMQHVKYLHIHSKEWAVRFSSNHHNENVFFKLQRR